MEVWNDSGSGYLPVGGTFFIGASPFETHPIWNIPDSLQTNARSLSLKVHDINGTYSDSDPVTMTFQAIPEPAAALGAMMMVNLGLLRCRQRANFIIS